MNARFILNRNKVIEQYNLVKEFGEVSYSLKTNPEVGKVLEEETECRFSVHSLKDLENIKDKKRIWFFLQGNDKEELKKLFDFGVNNFVVDNINDLNLLLQFEKKINLLLRMKLKENTIHTGKHFVFGFCSSKINELVPELRKDKNIGKLGIHFHRKTQNVSEWDLKEELIDSIKDFSLIDMVNIGGGIPYEYKNFRNEVLNSIFNKIKELKEFLDDKKIKMIIEPGRFIAAPSVKLEAEIINIYENNIIINCSVYNSAMDSFISHIRLLVEGELEKGKNYTIKGCTPDSLDIFRYSVFLNNPKIGDKIVFLNAGAYNFSTEFCNLEKLETVII